MSQRPTQTTNAGAPVGDNQNAITAGPRGPLLVQDWQLFEKMAQFNRERRAGAGGPRQGLRRPWHLHGDRRHHALLQGQRVHPGRQADRLPGALLDGRGRAWRGRCRARRARLRGQVLHRPGQLGHGRQQHPGVLRPRPVQVQRLHPHSEARPQDQHALQYRDVGLLVAEPGEPAPGHHPVRRSRPAAELPADQRLQQPHLQPDQCRGRALLGQVPLQVDAGHRLLDQ